MEQGQYYILKSDNQKQYPIKQISELDLSSGAHVVKVEKKLPSRSDRQRRYLWGWVYAHVEKHCAEAGLVLEMNNDREAPYTKDIIHQICKNLFLCIGERTRKDGSTYLITRSTEELKKEEYREYIENVTKLAWQSFKCHIPTPDRGYWFEYYKSLGLS